MECKNVRAFRNYYYFYATKRRGEATMRKYIMSAEDKVVQVASTLAIENMYVSENYKQELLLVAQGKKSSKDVLKELDEIYSKRRGIC